MNMNNQNHGKPVDKNASGKQDFRDKDKDKDINKQNYGAGKGNQDKR
jgi:hypothetical protein